MDNSEIKKITLDLYSILPDVYEERAMIGPDGKVHPELYPEIREIRDRIIEVNYRFFGYVASNSYIKNNYITYEDKFQSCLLHFAECWWKYKWKGDDIHRGYRQDLSFAVFFKPRLSEMIERELTEVKYSIERTMKMEAGNQLGKHWNKVVYEDLKDVDLPISTMNSLKAIFGALYIEDLSEFELYTPDKTYMPSALEYYATDTNFNSITRLLVYEMINQETKLDEKYLREMSEIYDIDYSVLIKHVKEAEDLLKRLLEEQLDISEGFSE